MQKLLNLFKADLIEEGDTDIEFRGLQDGTLYLILKKRFGGEISSFAGDLKDDLAEKHDQLITKMFSLQGKVNNLTGKVAEEMFATEIRNQKEVCLSSYFSYSEIAEASIKAIGASTKNAKSPIKNAKSPIKNAETSTKKASTKKASTKKASTKNTKSSTKKASTQKELAIRESSPFQFSEVKMRFFIQADKEHPTPNKNLELDILAETNSRQSLLVEMKKTQDKIGIKIVKEFWEKVLCFSRLYPKQEVFAAFFSAGGFTAKAKSFCEEQRIGISTQLFIDIAKI